MVEWLHQKSNNFNYTYIHFAFRIICNKGFVAIPKFLATHCNDFYVEIENYQLKNWKIVSKYQRKLLDYNNYIVYNANVEPCEICYENRQYYVKFGCSHMFCKDCSLDLHKCPMCFTIIDINNINLLKN